MVPKAWELKTQLLSKYTNFWEWTGLGSLWGAFLKEIPFPWVFSNYYTFNTKCVLLSLNTVELKVTLKNIFIQKCNSYIIVYFTYC